MGAIVAKQNEAALNSLSERFFVDLFSIIFLLCSSSVFDMGDV